MIYIPIPTIEDESQNAFTHFWRLEDELDFEAVKEALLAAGYQPEGHSCHCTHDCCGHWFARPMVFRHNRGRTIVSQRCLQNV